MPGGSVQLDSVMQFVHGAYCYIEPRLWPGVMSFGTSVVFGSHLALTISDGEREWKTTVAIERICNAVDPATIGRMRRSLVDRTPALR